MAIDKETLFTKLEEEEIVDIPGKGEIRVRALTRAEMHSMSSVPGSKNRAKEVEYRTVHFGMVDPELDIKEVEEWAKVASAGEFQLVLRKIMELSGMGADDEEVKEAQRAAYKSL